MTDTRRLYIARASSSMANIRYRIHFCQRSDFQGREEEMKLSSAQLRIELLRRDELDEEHCGLTIYGP